MQDISQDLDSQTQPDASPANAAQDADHAARIAEQEERIARLAAELARQKTALQHAESALIARIGDVDDDRRHADMMLQRAWQTQHAEMAARFKRHRWLTAGVLLLFGILVGLAAVFFHFQRDRIWQDMAEEVAQLRLALDQQTPPPNLDHRDQVIQDKLSNLSIALQSIYASLKPADQETDQSSPAVPPAPSHAIGAPHAADGPPAQTTGPVSAPPASVETETVDAPTTTDDRFDSEPGTPPADLPAASPPEPALEPPPEPLPTDPAAPDPDADASDAASADAAGTADVPHQIPVGDRPYAVQLIGFPSRDALQGFLERFQLTTQVVYYREETYRRRPWFALIHSLHESRESAQAALATLPPELRALKIWVRRLDPASVVVVLDPAS